MVSSMDCQRRLMRFMSWSKTYKAKASQRLYLTREQAIFYFASRETWNSGYLTSLAMKYGRFISRTGQASTRLMQGNATLTCESLSDRGLFGHNHFIFGFCPDWRLYTRNGLLIRQTGFLKRFGKCILDSPNKACVGSFKKIGAILFQIK